MGIGGYFPDYIFGNNVEGNYDVTAVNADYKYVTKFTLGSDDTIYALIHQINNIILSGINVNGIIYSDNAGYPDSLLAVSQTVTSVQKGWNAFQLSSPVFLTAGVYWLGLHSDTWIDSCESSYISNSTYSLADTYSDGPSDPFGAGGTSGSYAKPVYASGELTPILESGKLVSYAILDPPEGISVGKMVGYAILQEPDLNKPTAMVIT